MGNVQIKKTRRFSKYSIAPTSPNAAIVQQSNIVSKPKPMAPKAVAYFPLTLPEYKLTYVEVQTIHDKGDLFLTLPEEILLIILSQMDLFSLGNLEQTSKFWSFYLPRMNRVWLEALQRSEFANQIQFQNLITNTQVRFREIVHYKLRHRLCTKCNKSFREIELPQLNCQSHYGQWDLVHNGGGPSGVRWTCCGSTEKQSMKCTRNPPHAFNTTELSEHESSIHFSFRPWIQPIHY
jgi:hypothetical protein